MNLDTLISQQNPQWISSSYQKPEKDWFRRPFFEKALSWLDKRLIIALTGLRRTYLSSIEEKIEPSDYKNLLKLAKFLKADKALLVTKDISAERLIEGIKMKTIPACLLEEKMRPKFLLARNYTVHTYDEKTAQWVYSLACQFLPLVETLLVNAKQYVEQ